MVKENLNSADYRCHRQLFSGGLLSEFRSTVRNRIILLLAVGPLVGSEYPLYVFGFLPDHLKEHVDFFLRIGIVYLLLDIL